MDTSRNANNSKRNVIFIIVGIVLAVLVGVWCFSAVISNQKKAQEIIAILPGTEFVHTQSGTEKEKLEWKYTFESDRDVIFNYTYTDLHGKILEEKCSQENFEYTYNVSLFGSVSVTFNGNKWTFSLDDTGNPMSMKNKTYGTYYRNGYRGYTSSGAKNSSGSHTLVFPGGLFLATTIIFIALLVAFIKTKPVVQRKNEVSNTTPPATKEYATSYVDDDLYYSLAKHILLLLFTFGIWFFIWIYRVTGYTNCVKDEEERNPTSKLLLCLFVPFYLIYWTYKTAQRIDKMAMAKGLQSDLSTLCLILAIFVPIIPPILMQDKLNTIATANNAKATPSQKPQMVDNVTLGTAEELKTYKELLDQGVITQEEFDAKKKQLLGL